LSDNRRIDLMIEKSALATRRAAMTTFADIGAVRDFSHLF
jgi:hypothetical protein